MAAQETNPENGERATVALVASMVREVRTLTETGFKGVQHQLDQLTALPERISTLEERVKGQAARIDALERDDQRDSDAFRANLALLVSAAAVLAAVLVPLLTG